MSQALRVAYADPPYPGCAHLYPEKTEVDHVELIERLCEYDGWALSTNENALQYVLGICPPGVRVLAWCKSNAPPFFDHPYRAWEPVICKPARKSHPPMRVRSYLESAAPTGIQAGESQLTGSKPEGFCEWLIRCLGAGPSDSLDDLFPGTGVLGRVWDRWRAQPELWATEPRRVARQDFERLRRNDDSQPELSAAVGSAPEQTIEDLYDLP